MPKFPTIPDFRDDDIIAVATALRAVKLALEVVAGTRQGESKGAVLEYVQGYRPDPQDDAARRIGELWIDTTDDTMWYWNGDIWKQITA